MNNTMYAIVSHYGNEPVIQEYEIGTRPVSIAPDHYTGYINGKWYMIGANWVFETKEAAEKALFAARLAGREVGQLVFDK